MEGLTTEVQSTKKNSLKLALNTSNNIHTLPPQNKSEVPAGQQIPFIIRANTVRSTKKKQGVGIKNVISFGFKQLHYIMPAVTSLLFGLLAG